MAKIVTIKNPLTGQPAQVDKLDHTAQQIDDGLNIARGVSNPNLLDNWYFGNPVDQRQGRVVKPNTTYYSNNTLTTAAGTTSAYVTAYRYATGTVNGVNYASFKLEDSDTAPTYYAAPENVVRGYTGAGYGLDRWKGYDSGQVVLIYNDHISIKHGVNNGIIEFLDKDYFASLFNKTMTLSFLLMNNILLAYTFTTGNSEWWYNISIDGYRIEFGHTATPYIMITSANDIDVKAAKLELGSQQTLAHQENGVWVLNEIPNYGEQLARCQRYFYAVNTEENQYACFGTGIAYSSTKAYITVPIPVKMRAFPGITKQGSLALFLNGEYTAIAVSAISAARGSMQGLFELEATASGLTPGATYYLAANTDGAARLFFNSEL